MIMIMARILVDNHNNFLKNNDLGKVYDRLSSWGNDLTTCV